MMVSIASTLAESSSLNRCAFTRKVTAGELWRTRLETFTVSMPAAMSADARAYVVSCGTTPRPGIVERRREPLVLVT
jgi:hypothetical protein